MSAWNAPRKWAEGIAVQECCGHKKCNPSNPLCHPMEARVAICGYFVYNSRVLIDDLGVVWRYGDKHDLDHGLLRADTDPTDDGGEYFTSFKDARGWLEKNYGLLSDKIKLEDTQTENSKRPLSYWTENES